MPGLGTAVLLVFVRLADLAIPPTLSTYKLHLQVSWPKSAQGWWELLLPQDRHEKSLTETWVVLLVRMYKFYLGLNSSIHIPIFLWLLNNTFMCDTWKRSKQSNSYSVSRHPWCLIIRETWIAAHLVYSASSTLWARWGCGRKSRNPHAGTRIVPHAYTDPSGKVGCMDGFWSTWRFCPLNSVQGTWQKKNMLLVSILYK